MKRIVLALAVLVVGCGGKSSPTEPTPTAGTVYLTVWCYVDSNVGGMYQISGAVAKVDGPGFSLSATANAQGAAALPPFPDGTTAMLTVTRPALPEKYSGAVGPFRPGSYSVAAVLK